MTPTLPDSGFQRDLHEVAEELARSHLLPSAEECATVTDPVTPAWLAEAIDDLLRDQPAFISLLPDEGERHRMAQVFATIPLSPPLAYKLTMARDERPELFHHSLQVAFCAAALAHYSHLAPHEVVNAAVAGLFHDIGLLHVDPELLTTGRPLTTLERHHLYSHPLTAYLILEHSPIWHPIVSNAVLEHHERIDGSGYPKGLTGAKLGALGQLLAVAEIAATLLSLGGDYASRDRLSIILRMNAGKLNAAHCKQLLSMFPPSAVAAQTFRTPGIAIELLLNLSVALLRWDAISKKSPASPLAKLLDVRLTHLRSSLAEIGIDLEYWSTFSAGAEEIDDRSLGELEVAVREAIWQLHAIASEVHRRWDHLLPGSEPIVGSAQDWLSGVETLPDKSG